MGPDALAAMEDLDRARGDPQVDLGADQRVRDRIEKVMDLDVIVEVDPRAPPFRELPVVGGQGGEGVALDRLEQFAPAHPEFAHRAFIHALHDQRDGRVAFGEREERQMAQSAENVGLGESDSGFDFRLVPRPPRPRREDSDRIMGRHRAIGSVDFGVVERGLDDPAFQIVGNQQLRRAAEKAEHAHVRAGPIRQLLRPRRLGIGEVRGAEHANENLRLADFARRRISDPDPLARIVHERLLAGDMVLAHHRRQASFKTTKQIAEPRDMLWSTYQPLCCGPAYVSFLRGSLCDWDGCARLTQHKSGPRLANLTHAGVCHGSATLFRQRRRLASSRRAVR